MLFECLKSLLTPSDHQELLTRAFSWPVRFRVMWIPHHKKRWRPDSIIYLKNSSTFLGNRMHMNCTIYGIESASVAKMPRMRGKRQGATRWSVGRGGSAPKAG